MCKKLFQLCHRPYSMIRVHHLLPTLNTYIQFAKIIFAEGIIRLQLMFWRVRRRRNFYCYEIIKRRFLSAIPSRYRERLASYIMLLYELNSGALWICAFAYIVSNISGLLWCANVSRKTTVGCSFSSPPAVRCITFARLFPSLSLSSFFRVPFSYPS